jgi:hypothetical protein
MFWNKREEAAKPLPDLPQTPSFQLPNDIPATSPQKLPQFPQQPGAQFPQNGFHDDLETLSIHPPTQLRTSEISGSAPSLSSLPSYKPASSPSPSPSSFVRQKQEEVFVKLDKFQSARKALSTAQHQVDEIASTLKRIRETKLREEQELAAWEKEVSAAKAKVEEINGMLFEKL